MAKHDLITCADHEPDSHECRMICRGGLAACKVCSGAEGSLTTDCPGQPMTKEQSDGVYAGLLDYTEAQGWCNYEPRIEEIRRWHRKHCSKQDGEFDRITVLLKLPTVEEAVAWAELGHGKFAIEDRRSLRWPTGVHQRKDLWTCVVVFWKFGHFDRGTYELASKWPEGAIAIEDSGKYVWARLGTGPIKGHRVDQIIIDDPIPGFRS